MRIMAPALTCCVLVFGLAVTTDVHAEAVKATPKLTVFTGEQAPSAAALPTVLRGSATKRGSVDGRFGSRIYEPTRFQSTNELFLTDPISGEVLLCD